MTVLSHPPPKKIVFARFEKNAICKSSGEAIAQFAVGGWLRRRLAVIATEEIFHAIDIVDDVSRCRAAAAAAAAATAETQDRSGCLSVVRWNTECVAGGLPVGHRAINRRKSGLPGIQPSSSPRLRATSTL